MHKSQIFLYFVTSFIAGIFTGSFIELSPLFIIIFISVGTSGLIVFWPEMRNSKPQSRGDWRVVVIACCLMIFIFGISHVNTYKSRQSIVSQFGDRNLSITMYGYIDGEPVVDGDSQKLIFRVKQVIVPQYVFNTNEKILIIQKSYPRLNYGESFRVVSKIELPKIIPSTGFDYKNYLAKDGISALAYYSELSPEKIQLSWLERSKLFIFSKIFTLKRAFEYSVQQAMIEPNASFVNGILLGSRGGIPNNVKESFSRTGMTHVLAISGYNIAIVAEIFALFFLLFFKRSTAFWITVFAIIIFTILTGSTSSVVRAAVMGILVLLARREGRMYRVRNAIAVAAAGMLFIDPMVLRYDVGFQLSFMATFGLIFLSPRLEQYFAKWPERFHLKETMVISLSAQIFVLPILFYQFGNLSLTSLPANLLVLPMMPYTMLLGFLTGAAGMASPMLGHILGYFAWFLTGIQLWLVSTLSSFSWSSIHIDVGWWILPVGYALIVFILLRKKFKNLMWQKRA